MKPDKAMELISAYRIDVTKDFHALDSDTVDSIIAAADSVKYRKPHSANGSRARYFHAALRRGRDTFKK